MPRFIPVVLPLVFLFVVPILPGCSSTPSSTRSYIALKFANDQNSYISFNPDMSSMTEKFSVCFWIRKLSSSSYPVPLSYGGSDLEIFISDEGYFNVLFGVRTLDGTLTSEFTAPQGTWLFYCSTWSLLSRTFRIYVNGRLVRSQLTPSNRRLRTGLEMTLGNRSPTFTGHPFGGEMFNLNLFSKELTASEVASMSELGLCTSIPEQLQDYRVIKWEELLKLHRTGTVTDRDSNCAPIAELQSRLKEIENEAAITQGKLDVAAKEKNALEDSLNKTQSELLKVKGLFNTSEEELDGVKRQLSTSEEQLTETRLELEETKLELKNVSESGCALVKGNLTKWDIFYSRPFYNKTFTRRLYQELKTTWDSISSQLFGVTLTDTIIKLIKNVDEQKDCEDL